MSDGTSDHRVLATALAELASALDRRDWTAIGAAFAPDAVGYGAHGREAIVARTRAHLGGCGPSQHLLGNVRVQVDGDTARTLTYARVYHQGAGAQAGRFFECMGEYDDRWVRTAEGWRLTRRVFDLQIGLGDFAVLQPG
ncbi:nuclear transport factor 2 family protein [Blastococcus sp. SYSU D00820]